MVVISQADQADADDGEGPIARLAFNIRVHFTKQRPKAGVVHLSGIEGRNHVVDCDERDGSLFNAWTVPTQ